MLFFAISGSNVPPPDEVNGDEHEDDDIDSSRGGFAGQRCAYGRLREQSEVATQDLVKDLLEDLLRLAKRAGDLMIEKMGPVFMQLSQLDEQFVQLQGHDVPSPYKKLTQELNDYCRSTPIIGFNTNKECSQIMKGWGNGGGD